MALMTNRPIATAAELALGTTYLWGHTGSGPATDRRVAISSFLYKNASGHVDSMSSFQVTGETHRFIGTSNFTSFYNAANTVRNGYVGHFGTDFAINNDLNGEVTLGTNNIIRVRVSAAGHVLAGADNAQTMGGAANRWSVVYAATGTINTSDERAKTDIGDVPEEWLDAWGDVQWKRFKFTDGNRWHIGLVAQQVHAAFAAHNIDAFEIGLCCFDEWQEVQSPIYEDVDGERVDTGMTEVTQEAGNRWGLRYDECQAIEAAWQRREWDRLNARIAALEE